MTVFRFASTPSLLFALLVALMLTGCGNTKTYSSIDPSTADARSGGRLEIPPDLEGSTSDSVLASQARQDAASSQVLPEPEDLEVERNDTEGWIEVDLPIDRAWSRLVAYWGALGVDLVVADPKLGLMETDWVIPAGDSPQKQPFHKALMDQIRGALTGGPTALDRYAIELERRGDSRTRISVSHRGRKKIETQKSNIANPAQYDWVETEENPKKVQRALSSIVYGLESGAGADAS